MGDYDWRVVTVDSPSFNGVEIFVYRKIDPTHKEFLTEGGNVVRTVKNNAEAAKEGLYFCKLPDDYLAQLLVEALQKKGIQSPAKSFVEGELTATKLHLDDMRKLTFGGQDRITQSAPMLEVNKKSHHYTEE